MGGGKGRKEGSVAVLMIKKKRRETEKGRKEGKGAEIARVKEGETKGNGEKEKWNGVRR